ncbi:uncharacterized protein LOC130993700 [Salvia miltiorrhiza]|uniref:uncharacterized protein LOC130993700 n=1 Tax=Salvia miltiorrhiza TaxID=226208 RepID=UPI0025AB897E|nr:uncharacterized protein LOC130993700 [Salvia miltiorrhiza]
MNRLETNSAVIWEFYTVVPHDFGFKRTIMELEHGNDYVVQDTLSDSSISPEKKKLLNTQNVRRDKGILSTIRNSGCNRHDDLPYLLCFDLRKELMFIIDNSVKLNHHPVGSNYNLLCDVFVRFEPKTIYIFI